MGDSTMWDIFGVGATLFCFALGLAYMLACEKLKKGGA